tara:strand:- start:416 stop:739 length:324 start_codon:yes stop_codon:yes gene_type:complete
MMFVARGSVTVPVRVGLARGALLASDWDSVVCAVVIESRVACSVDAGLVKAMSFAESNVTVPLKVGDEDEALEPSAVVSDVMDVPRPSKSACSVVPTVSFTVSRMRT